MMQSKRCFITSARVQEMQEAEGLKKNPHFRFDCTVYLSTVFVPKQESVSRRLA